MFCFCFLIFLTKYFCWVIVLFLFFIRYNICVLICVHLCVCVWEVLMVYQRIAPREICVFFIAITRLVTRRRQISHAWMVNCRNSSCNVPTSTTVYRYITGDMEFVTSPGTQLSLFHTYLYLFIQETRRQGCQMWA